MFWLWKYRLIIDLVGCAIILSVILFFSLYCFLNWLQWQIANLVTRIKKTWIVEYARKVFRRKQ